MVDMNREDTQHNLPCCGITAVAVFSGASFKDVWDTIAPFKPGNWKGSTKHADQKHALKKFNKGRTVSVRVRDRMTLEKFARLCAEPGHVYMIRTTGHQQVLKDGMVTDQGGCRPIREYWGRKKMVKHFWCKKG